MLDLLYPYQICINKPVLYFMVMKWIVFLVSFRKGRIKSPRSKSVFCGVSTKQSDVVVSCNLSEVQKDRSRTSFMIAALLR